MSVELLFSTPVWTFQFDESLNKKILNECADYNHGMNVFDMTGEGMSTLKTKIKEYVTPIADEYGWKPQFIRGRVNPILPNTNDTPHYHHYAMMVGVYYAIAEPNQGDILLHDPRGSVWWKDPKVVNDINKTGRTYHRITPKAGMLIMFPSYLIHSVETNLTNKVRLSIAIEIHHEK